MKKLTKNIFYHTTSDGMNIGCVIGDDAVACIDLPLNPEEARAWRAQIGEWSDKPIRAVIFTASDRMSGEAMAAMGAGASMGAPAAVLHDAAFAQLAVPSEPAMTQLLESATMPFLRDLGSTPQVTFSQSISIALGVGVKQATFVDVLFQGGYSPDACFVIPRDSGIAFAGDHVAIGQPPNLSQGNFEQWQAVLTALKKNRAITTVVPGRGLIVAPAASVKETLEYIKTATTRVRALVRANRGRGDLGGLVPDLLALYAPRSSRGKSQSNLDAMGRQVRAGLERIYDDLKVRSEK